MIFRAGSLRPVRDQVAIGRMITFGGLFFRCDEAGYQPPPAPIMHGWIVPIGRINTSVDFTGSAESVGSPSPAELALDDPANSDNNTLAVSSGSGNGGNDLDDDAGSIQPATSVDDLDDPESILPVMDYESDEGSVGPISAGTDTPTAVYMAQPNAPPNPNGPAPGATAGTAATAAAGDGRTQPRDPLSTPITAETPTTDLEAIRASMQAEQERQREARERLRIERTQLQALSDYRNRLASSRLPANS